MTLAAVICGAKDWPQIVVASEGMVSWLSSYVDMSGGIPCERTLKTYLMPLNLKLWNKHSEI